MGFCISYVLGSKTTNIHTLTDRPQKMCSLSSRPWMCLGRESPFCPVTMTPVGILLVEFLIVLKRFFFFPSDGLSLNKITWDVERTSVLCEHCDSVFTFTSHGFTQLHLDSCTMCVAKASIFSLMWVLLFHGPCTVYSSLYGLCDCFQLFARRKKIVKWYSCAWNSDTSTRILLEIDQGGKLFRTQAKALTISTVQGSAVQHF